MYRTSYATCFSLPILLRPSLVLLADRNLSILSYLISTSKLSARMQRHPTYNSGNLALHTTSPHSMGTFGVARVALVGSVRVVMTDSRFPGKCLKICFILSYLISTSKLSARMQRHPTYNSGNLALHTTSLGVNEKIALTM
jgi:hypothetical protein